MSHAMGIQSAHGIDVVTSAKFPGLGYLVLVSGVFVAEQVVPWKISPWQAIQLFRSRRKTKSELAR